MSGDRPSLCDPLLQMTSCSSQLGFPETAIHAPLTFFNVLFQRIPVQLHYVQLTTHKANADDLSSGVFAILISVT